MITRLSRWMARVSAVLLLGLAVAVIWQTGRWIADPRAIADAYPGVVHDIASIGLATRAAIVGLGLVNAVILGGVINAFRVVFARFAAGRVFNGETAVWMRRAGLFAVSLAAWGVIRHTLCVLVLSLGNPPGQHMISISLDGAMLVSLFLAGMFFVLAHVLVLATEVARENREFV